ncbi:MAG: hypothetical protein HGB08_01810 [Candidatus Moranbacteria bacterium]|nr:hypothetical protein [Candidatus Moranbacteria bacterium]
MEKNYVLLLIAVSVWTIPWKGIALWRAAKNNDRAWFLAILILNTLAILEILYIFVFFRKNRNGRLD